MSKSRACRNHACWSAVLVSLVAGRSAFAVDAAPKGYTVLKTTAAGRVLAVKRDKPTTVHDAIEATLNDLDDYFDDDYDVYGGAENTADKKSGFATIKAKYDGHAVNGMVQSRLTATGSINMVVFLRADAPRTAWAELTGMPAGAPGGGGNGMQAGGPAMGGQAPPAGPSINPLDPPQGQISPQPDGVRGWGGAAGDAGGQPGMGGPPGMPQQQQPLPPQMQQPELQQPGMPPQMQPQLQQQQQPPQPQQIRLSEYRFPDNTGSIGLPDGWQPNPAQGLQFKGPAGQTVSLGVSTAVSIPNSQAVQLARQYPVPGHVLFVAPFDDPGHAMANLIPQFSQFSASKGGPMIEADNIRVVKSMPPTGQGSRDAMVTYGLTRTTNGQRDHLQCLVQVSMTPITSEAWMIYMTGCEAPDASFQTDVPLMMTIIGSWRTNDAQINANTQQWVAGRQQWFAGQQQAQATVQQGFDDKNKGWWANQNTTSRAMDTFSEGMRGFRDIEDTRTGELNPADLGHVDQIVKDLNEQEPGRYKELSLRDKLDPTPGR